MEAEYAELSTCCRMPLNNGKILILKKLYRKRLDHPKDPDKQIWELVDTEAEIVDPEPGERVICPANKNWTMTPNDLSKEARRAIGETLERQAKRVERREKSAVRLNKKTQKILLEIKAAAGNHG